MCFNDQKGACIYRANSRFDKCAHPIDVQEDVLLVVSYQRMSFLPKLICRRVLLTISPTTCSHHFVIEESADDFLITFKEGDWNKIEDDEVVYDIVPKSSVSKLDIFKKVNNE